MYIECIYLTEGSTAVTPATCGVIVTFGSFQNWLLDSKGSFLEIITSHPAPELDISFVKERGKERKEEKITLNDFIAVKGEKAQGNKLSSKKVHKLTLIENEIEQQKVVDEVSSSELSDEKNKSESLDSELNSKNKIIIDEDSTNNQFKLEL